MKKLFTYSDGGARGNPGPAALGVVIKNPDGETIEAYGEYLGRQTNNFAEYSGLISALNTCKRLEATHVVCYVDSLLVEKQLNREWRVKDESIQKLFVKAWNAMQGFEKVEIKHVLREKNKEADEQVNLALDRNV